MGKTQKEICVLLQNHPQPALAETEPGAETTKKRARGVVDPA
eukprot:COSAG06_NODE_23676_length_684_cov_1.355556_1_plen_41_part_10